MSSINRSVLLLLDMTRDAALKLINDWTKNPNLVKHMLAVEAQMRTLAKHFGESEDDWGLAGLIHDADWEETKADPSLHTVNALDWLAQEGCTAGPIVQGLRSHNRKHTSLGEIESVMEWALECADELTGFIVSVALVRPDKKLASVEVASVLKKWKNKDFAAAVDRSQIEQCQEKLGIKLPEFVEIVLEAMKGVASEIGL